MKSDLLVNKRKTRNSFSHNFLDTHRKRASERMSRLDKIREGEGEGESSRLEIELFLRFHAAVVPPSLKTFLLFQLLFFLFYLPKEKHFIILTY